MENNSCTKICRFCLESSNSNFETVEEVTLANLDFLWLKVNLTLSEEPVMCKDCAKSIRTCLDFKTKCLQIEDCIVSSVKDRHNIKVDLQEVYVSKMSIGSVVNVPDDHTVCRLCLELVENDSASFLRNGTDIVVKLEQYFPELDLTCTEDPVICASCQVYLQSYFSFIDKCLTTEEKIVEYCKVEGTNGMGQIDLNSILHFVSKDFLKCKFEVDIGKIEGMCNEVTESISNNVEMKKEEILDMELDIKEDSSSQESELSDEDSFQHPTSSQSQCGDNCEIYSFKTNTKDYLKKQIFKYEDSYQDKHKQHLQAHIITYKEGTEETMYKCDLCDYETKRKFDLNRHVRTYKSHSETNMYKCDLCDYEAKGRSNLKVHMLTHKTHSENTRYKCYLCGCETKRKSDLKRHMLTHKTHSEATVYKCNLCSCKTKRKFDLKRHMLTHKTHQITMYKCDLCDKVVKWKSDLKEHMLIHKTHSGITMYKCDVCDYKVGLKAKANLKRHMLTHKTHLEITMYKCDLCSYETPRKPDLKRHMLTHKTSSKTIMYKCEMCAYETGRKDHLQSHTLIHMDVSEIEMHKCQVCSFETKWKGYFQKHLLSHKNTVDVPSNMRDM